MHEVAVIGGGIVGSSVGYHLARAGVDTVLLDREDEGRATAAGAGILSPATSSRTDSDTWFEFAIEAVAYYDDLVAALEAEQDGDTGYARPGLLSVALDDAEVEAFEAAMSRIERRQADLGSPEPGSFRELSPAEARERLPALAEDVRRAASYENAARVDGRIFTEALRRAGRAHGLEIRRTEAEGIRVEDGAVAGVETEDGALDAERVVVAGGAWSGAFGDDLGVEIPVEPKRGQIAHLGAAELDTADWPIVSPFRGHYVVPWPDDRVVAGATREAGSGFAPYKTAGGVREVLDECLRVVPGLDDAELEEIRVGLRPVSADKLPVLGEVPDVDGAFIATGHGATGLQLGPYSGKLVAQAARGADVETDISAFGVERFEG
ncbi:NAD(P)/FAD-dependent oxidoreductase [Halorussus amylolyticus]|uniref:NAD(P)/FAD-dependent oxidoreductase n=1 Tax=Halorussus amylolyticus TaxID=1126242 RepID=UPI001046873F|nr:FAD-dependent oxidoreductase [Halorussus amylolyticus]